MEEILDLLGDHVSVCDVRAAHPSIFHGACFEDGSRSRIRSSSRGGGGLFCGCAKTIVGCHDVNVNCVIDCRITIKFWIDLNLLDE